MNSPTRGHREPAAVLDHRGRDASKQIKNRGSECKKERDKFDLEVLENSCNRVKPKQQESSGFRTSALIKSGLPGGKVGSAGKIDFVMLRHVV